MKRSTYTASLILLSLIVSIGLDYTGSFRYIEHTILDDFFVRYQRDYKPNDISLVMIDQPGLVQMGTQLKTYWPWPREIHALMNDFLDAKGAKKVVYDILFDQPDFDRENMSGEESDLTLANSFGVHDNAIIGAQIEDINVKTELPHSVMVTRPDENLFPLFSSLPIETLFYSATAIGNTAVPTSFDGVVRYTQIVSYHGDKAIPSLSLAALLSEYKRSTFNLVNDEKFLNLEYLDPIPIQENGLYLINWYKKGGVENGTFPQYSYFQLLKEAVSWKKTGVLVSDDQLNIRNHTIFIGASAPGLSDIKATPFSRLEPFPGVEIQATVYANLLHKDHLKKLNPILKWFFIFFGIVLINVLIFYAIPRTSIIIAVIWTISCVYLSMLIFEYFRIWIPVAELTMIQILTVTLSFTTRFVTENKERKFLKQAFSRYVPKDLVNEVINRPESLKLGGDKKEMTVLFSDLAGFTSISEGMSPEELVPYLNEYLTQMTDLVFKHRGTLDKYIGDAIMAFWGAPLDDPEHALNACSCVIEMQELMLRMQEKWEITGKPITSTRYGVNTGYMVVGNVGSLERFNYTVLGDAVNLAARLEPANKNFGTDVMISETTYDLVKHAFVCRELDQLIVKGKSKPVKVFELIGRISDTAIQQKFSSPLENYKQGLLAYYKRDWDLATSLFNQVLADKPNDGPAKTYLGRIEQFKRVPPPEDWNGVFELKTK